MRHWSECGEVEGSVMSGTIFAHQSCPVETEHNIEPCDSHIMDDVIIGTLGKSTIDIAVREPSLGSHTCGEGDGMSFSYAHIKGTLGHRLHHDIHRASRRHGWCHTHNLLILLCQFQEGLAKHILIAWWFARGVVNQSFTGIYIKFPRCMP